MLPVTATEVFVEFKRPPMETFGEIVPGTSVHLRMRISPDIAIGMGVRVKTPGERMTGRDVELLLNGAPTTCLPTSDWWATPRSVTSATSRPVIRSPGVFTHTHSDGDVRTDAHAQMHGGAGHDFPKVSIGGRLNSTKTSVA